MKLIKCDESHIRAVQGFYHMVVGYLEANINYPFWSKDHPSDESTEAAVRNGEQYICVDDGGIIGAVLLSEDPDGDYDSVSWSRDLSRGEYLSVHVLGVKPECFGMGVGGFMVDECIAIARRLGYKAVRLDIVPTNAPAEQLYRKKGFTYAGTADLKRPSAPIPLFDLYEFNF